MTAKRVTSILLSKDINASATPYVQNGFARRNTEEAGCIGLVSGDGTGLMLLQVDYARRSMPSNAIDALAEKGGLYVWLDELPAHDQGQLLGEAITEYGTHERFVVQDDVLVVYAQKLNLDRNDFK
jgi:hypothetical protein